MSNDTDSQDITFAEWLASCRGVRKLLADDTRDNEALIEWAGGVWNLLEYLGSDAKRHAEAHKLLHVLQPTEVDAELWEELALKGRASLLASHQFGRQSSGKNVGPGSNPAAAPVPKKDPKAQFFDRQGKAVVAAEAKIARLKEELAAAETHRSELQNGLQAFASAALLVQIRKAAASMFAMGPAWTVLRAIQGSTGDEVTDESRVKETKRILTVLHALRGHLPFEEDVKRALLDVCHRWMAEAARRGKPGSEFDGPEDYELILKNLGWPEEQTVEEDVKHQDDFEWF